MFCCVLLFKLGGVVTVIFVFYNIIMVKGGYVEFYVSFIKRLIGKLCRNDEFLLFIFYCKYIYIDI